MVAVTGLTGEAEEGVAQYIHRIPSSRTPNFLFLSHHCLLLLFQHGAMVGLDTVDVLTKAFATCFAFDLDADLVFRPLVVSS
jgi:hypothetical protein